MSVWSMMDKQKSREIRVQIGQVLWEVWDPIGVNDNPLARDEYSGYVSGVFQLVAGDASDQEIVEHLYGQATGHMGLPHVNRDQIMSTVYALRKIHL
jgi:hypothetical protein